jgi:hypothetical protein
MDPIVQGFRVQGVWVLCLGGKPKSFFRNESALSWLISLGYSRDRSHDILDLIQFGLYADWMDEGW